jgi:hypothetical protein
VQGSLYASVLLALKQNIQMVVSTDANYFKIRGHRDVVSTLLNFAFELLNDCCCSHLQFRIVVHPLCGPADGRTVMLKSLKKIYPVLVIGKKSPFGRFHQMTI